jgi:hypothetical protein
LGVQFAFEFHVGFTTLVHIFEQVNSSLILAVPLLLLLIPHLCRLLSHKSVDHFLIVTLVSFLLVIELLQGADLIASRLLFGFLKLLDLVLTS